MKKRLCIAIAVVLIFSMMLCACGETKPQEPTGEPEATPEEQDTITLAYITHTTTNIYWDTVVSGFEDQCEAEGVEFITYDSGSDAGTQLTQVEDCLSMGVDAVLLSPLDDASSLAMTEMCRDAGVPILIVDIGTVNDVDFVVLSDNYGAGRMLGEHAYTKHSEDLKAVVITTPLGFTIGELRTGGTVDYLKEQDVEPLATYTLSMSWDRAECMSAVEDAIAACP